MRPARPPACERVRVRRHEPERVRGARGGQRVAARRPARTHAYSSGSPSRGATSSSSARRGPTGRRSRRRQAGDVRAARAVPRRAALEQRHAAAGRTDDPAVDRADARRAAHDRSERSTGRPPLTTDTFELVPPHSTTIASVSPAGGAPPRRPPRGRSRSEAGPTAEGVDAHRAAVATEDEQRHVESRVRERLLDEGCRPLNDGKDARVDRSADGAHLEAVGAGQVVADAGRKPARLCALRHQELVAGLVDGEGAADRDGGTAGGGERLEGGVHVPWSRPRVTSMKACSVSSECPGASATEPTRVRLRAARRSGCEPIPRTPTRPTSPSSSAFMAWVVENATSATRLRSWPSSARRSRSASTTPSATPPPRARSGRPRARAAGAGRSRRRRPS